MAPADFIETTPQMRNTRAVLAPAGWKALDPAVSYLFGPHFSGAINGLATATELAWQDLDDSGLPMTGLPTYAAVRARRATSFSWYAAADGERTDG